MLKELKILDSLNGAAALIQNSGNILYTNKKWNEGDRFYNWFGMEPGSDNYFSHCEKAVQFGNDYALKLVFGLRGVLDGIKPSFEISCHVSRNGEKFWYRVSVTPFENETDERQVLLVFDDITKNMLNLRMMRENEEIYAQHFEHSISGILLISADGSIIDANPVACKILGYSKAELLKGGREMIAPLDEPLNKKGYRIREERSIYEGDKIYLHKTGKKITVEISSVVYHDENGKKRIINTFRDKSNEQEIMNRLKEEQRFTKTALNSIPGIFFVIDKQMNVVRWNDSFQTELGFSIKEIKSNSILDYFTNKDSLKVLKAAEEAFEFGAAHVVAEVMSKNKGIRNYHIFGSRFNSNGNVYLVGSGTDITDLVESEKEKDKNYELMAQLFDNSPLAMIMINPDEKVMRVNNGFEDLFGYEKIELIGENVNEFITDSEYIDEAESISKLAFKGKMRSYETIRYSKSGQALSVRLYTVPIRREGSIMAIYGIYVDLTQQKQLEEQIQKSLHEKEILIQEVHHRVKNNLAVIAGLVDLQIMEEENEDIINKLNEVRSRVFSIAKIHEILYREADVVNIRFDKYLEVIVEALPLKGIDNTLEVDITLNTEPLKLNLNQAVPGGLVVNELMNILLSGDVELKSLDISLIKKKNIVTIIFQGNEIAVDKLKSDGSSKPFQFMLIDLFLKQMDASLRIENGALKRAIIEFKTSNKRGSSSSLKDPKQFQNSDKKEYSKR